MRVFAKSVAVFVGAAIAVTLCLAIFASVVPTRFERRDVEKRWGKEIARSIYGVCDPAYQAFLSRRNVKVDDSAEASARFALSGLGQGNAILKSEDNQILSIIERAFGWQVAPDTKFKVRLRDNGYATFYPIAMNMDGIELDECGYLIGDDYDTRVRHADSVRNRP